MNTQRAIDNLACIQMEMRDAQDVRQLKRVRIDTVDVAISALKKQIPRKVKIYEEEILKCPICNEGLGYFKESGFGYCIDCGQKIEFIEE